ncbi:conserved hypothetical protein [Hahella chejuensis KCTC 2396]|uniref:MSHA biogenesis protein MshI n=1 Tax=Hahella chejuensis (strain KCTC 2396) TaxID=349521 RepID=Q2S971_HAHCH|nr:hypothetical protein [Hahella chejuensis]ABC32803.1 conserved hypothetical protein [Hahella chejuensis KCTC 2396]
MLSWLSFSKGKKGLVGIEVRPDGMAIAVSEPAGGQSHIRAIDYLDARAAQRAGALKAFVNERKLEKMACNLVLPPEMYALHQIERPSVEESELREAVRWKVKDLLDYAIDDAIIDVFEYPSDALRGRPAQVNVVTARKSLLKELIRVINDSGLVLSSIDITELALRNLAQPFEEDGKSLGLMMMRENTGLMLLIKNGSVYLSRRLDADMEALADPERKSWVGQQLALEVQRSFDYFESQMGQAPPRRLMAGSVVNEAELLSQLDEALGLTVQTLQEDKVGLPDDQLASAIHWVACGGAMRKAAGGRKSV